MRTQEIKDELPSTRFKQKKLIARPIDDELLLFNEETNTAHCLNGIAGEMWKACERQSSVADVAAALHTRWPDMDKEVVQASLSRMAAAGLLEETIDEEISTGRRDLIRKLGFAAAAVLPIVVTSVLIPPAAAAASCGHLLAECGAGKPPCCAGFHCLVGVCEPL